MFGIGSKGIVMLLVLDTYVAVWTIGILVFVFLGWV